MVHNRAMGVNYFDCKNLSELEFAEDANGEYAKRVLVPLVMQGPRRFFDNVDCEVGVLEVDGVLLPISITSDNARVKNAYVCSPTTHYIDYCKREVDIEFSRRRITGAILKAIIGGFQAIFVRRSFDQVVMVNNWLLSTNLYPPSSNETLEAISRFLIERFPKHAIVYRSVNPILNESMLKTLQQVGFKKVLSRQVYLMDVCNGDHLKRQAIKIDRRLQRASGQFNWESLAKYDSSDVSRIKQLYDSLYLEKYSHFNPQFTEAFFRQAIEQEWLQLSVLRRVDGGEIVAVVGYFNRNGVMTTPVIGYDRTVPQSVGLYRLITLRIIDEAVSNENFLHMSSGAAHFKMLRGGKPCFEYNMVRTSHLSWSRRMPWNALAWLTRWVAMPVFRWFKL